MIHAHIKSRPKLLPRALFDQARLWGDGSTVPGESCPRDARSASWG